jgi:diguanylate cyclase (GGDEF)-like protein
MVVPQLSIDESARLRLLATLGIIDMPRVEEIDRITRLAARYFQVKGVLVSLIDADKQWFLSFVGIDFNQAPRDTSFCGHTILQPEPTIVMDARLDLRFHDNPLVTGAPHIVFYAGCPLLSQDGVALGTFCLVDDKTRHWSDEDRQTLCDLTALVQSFIFSLENLQYKAQLEYEANHDALTGLPNRRAFQQSLDYLVGQQESADRDMALLFLDIDNFKAYNDTYGHEFGDLVLKFFGHVLRDNVRTQDIVARLAGDEFTILLHQLEHSESDVSRICNGLLAALGSIEKVAGIPVALSASIGVCFGRARQHLIPDTLMARADAAMYRAKQAGKGRYVLG